MDDSIECKQCGGEMRKGKKYESSMALQLVGVLLFFIGVALCFFWPIGTVIGVIFMISSLGLGHKKRKGWVCKGCGYFFETA